MSSELFFVGFDVRVEQKNIGLTCDPLERKQPRHQPTKTQLMLRKFPRL